MKKPYTQLENETMEALARAPLTAREFRVMLAVIRLTNGFHLTETKVPMKALIQLTGLARNHLQATVKRLALWQAVVYKDGFIACHGPALWRFPDSPKSGLSGRPAGIPAQSQVGTVPDSPKSGLSQIVPSRDCLADTKTPRIKESTKKVQRKGPTQPSGRVGGGDPQRGSGGAPDPRVPEVLRAIEKKLGQQIPHYAKEGAAVKRALAMGFTPEEVQGCWEKMKGFPFWGGKWLPLASVVENLGEFRAGRLSDGRRRTGGPWEEAKEYTEPA